MWPVDYGSGNNRDTLYFNWHTTGQTFNTEKIENETGDYYLLYLRSIELFVFYDPESSPQLVKYMDNILV
jgi:hypothetical protein